MLCSSNVAGGGGSYGTSLVMFVMYSVGSLAVLMTCVVGRVLWWLCGVGEFGFGHLIVVLYVAHKCGFALVVGMGVKVDEVWYVIHVKVL